MESSVNEQELVDALYKKKQAAKQHTYSIGENRNILNTFHHVFLLSKLEKKIQNRLCLPYTTTKEDLEDAISVYNTKNELYNIDFGFRTLKFTLESMLNDSSTYNNALEPETKDILSEQINKLRSNIITTNNDDNNVFLSNFKLLQYITSKDIKTNLTLEDQLKDFILTAIVHIYVGTNKSIPFEKITKLVKNYVIKFLTTAHVNEKYNNYPFYNMDNISKLAGIENINEIIEEYIDSITQNLIDDISNKFAESHEEVFDDISKKFKDFSKKIQNAVKEDGTNAVKKDDTNDVKEDSTNDVKKDSTNPIVEYYLHNFFHLPLTNVKEQTTFKNIFNTLFCNPEESNEFKMTSIYDNHDDSDKQFQKDTALFDDIINTLSDALHNKINVTEEIENLINIFKIEHFLNMNINIDTFTISYEDGNDINSDNTNTVKPSLDKKTKSMTVNDLLDSRSKYLVSLHKFLDNQSDVFKPIKDIKSTREMLNYYFERQRFMYAHSNIIVTIMANLLQQQEEQ